MDNDGEAESDGTPAAPLLVALFLPTAHGAETLQYMTVHVELDF